MQVKLPRGARVVRHTPVPQVSITGDAPPLIDPKDPDHKQIQEIYTAKVQVFDLSKPEDIKALEEVWQKICNKQALPSENVTTWSTDKQAYVTFMRWSELSYVAPSL